MKKTMLAAVLALLCSAPQFAHATNDGTPSTGSFSIVNGSSLTAASATGSLTVVTTTALLGTRIAIGPYVLQAGIDYQVGVSTFAAATNLTAAINAITAGGAGGIGVTAAYVAGNAVITLTAVNSGSLYNGITLNTSNSSEISVSGANLTGGQNNASVSINGVTLIQGRDWFVQDVSSNTAISLAEAINHNGVLKNFVSGYWSGSAGTVYLRSLLTATAYPLSVADNSANNSNITLSGATMTGGAL